MFVLVTHVHVVREVSPSSLHPSNAGLSTQNTHGPNFERDTSNFTCECVELGNHVVDRVLECSDFALSVDLNGLVEVALGDGSSDNGDGSDLVRKVLTHPVDL